MSDLRLAAPAKINLFLHVTGKRADGFHLLDSLVVFTEFGDHIALTPSESITLNVQGPFAIDAGDIKENLVFKAAIMLRDATGQKQGARIVLDKHIPVGAGLGGGSSDAAAALNGLARLWKLPDSGALLRDIALQLGSDVASCLEPSPQQMRGVGDQLAAVTCNAQGWLLLANPGEPLLTARVYKEFREAFTGPVSLPSHIESLESLVDVLMTCRNDLQPAAIRLMPAIHAMLAAIEETPGCLIARMSGSGATCFGIYNSRAEAEAAQIRLLVKHPTWWIRTTALQGTTHETQ